MVVYFLVLVRAGGTFLLVFIGYFGGIGAIHLRTNIVLDTSEGDLERN